MVINTSKIRIIINIIVETRVILGIELICVEILSLARRPCIFCIEVSGLKTVLVRSSFVTQKLPRVIVCFWFCFLLFVCSEWLLQLNNACYDETGVAP